MRLPSVLYIGVLLAISLAACAPDEGDPAPSATAPPRMHLDHDPHSASYGSVAVEGLDAGVLRRIRAANLSPEAWAAFFAVYAPGAAAATMPPVLGDYAVEPPRIRFTPRFPFEAGLTYTVRIDGARLADLAVPLTLDTTFTVAASADTAPTVVTQVYPTADTLPANLLKFYIHFSAPMQAGHAYANLQIIDQGTGRPVAAPFVALEPELWDPDQRRITILFDPGRIKREVGPNRELGAPLQPGHAYRLVLNRRWPDATGQPLQDEYVKSFAVVEADRSQPNPDTWHLDAPLAQTMDPVVLTFSEPLDHALLQRLITVYDAAGTRLDGTITVGQGETQWAFVPVAPWQAGPYTLHIETILEDLAGNTLRSLFDVDVAEAPASEVREAETLRVVPFRVDALVPVP